MSFFGSEVQNRVTQAVQKAQVSTSPQQVLHHSFLPGDYCQVQGGLGGGGEADDDTGQWHRHAAIGGIILRGHFSFQIEFSPLQMSYSPFHIIC